MITKEMLLAGMKQGIVRIGTYSEGGVDTPEAEDTMDMLACSIGDDTFYFGGDEDDTIQNYLEANSDDTVATGILEALEEIRDELDSDEYSYCEAYLRATLDDKSILPRQYFIVTDTESLFQMANYEKRVSKEDYHAEIISEANFSIGKLGLPLMEKFLFIPRGEDDALWNEDEACVIGGVKTFGASMVDKFPNGFSVMFTENEPYFTCFNHEVVTGDFDGVLIPQSWARDAMTSSELSCVIGELAKLDEEISNFVEEAKAIA